MLKIFLSFALIILINKNSTAQIRIFYRSQCKEYHLDEYYPRYIQPRAKIKELVHFFYVSGIENKIIQQRINDQLLLIYCYPEEEFLFTKLDNLIILGQKPYTGDRPFLNDNLVIDSIYSDIELKNGRYFDFKISDTTESIIHNLFSNFDLINSHKVWSANIDWEILKNKYLIITTTGISGIFLTEESVIASDRIRYEKGFNKEKDYTFRNSTYSFVFDLKTGNLLNFWDLIKVKKRYKFLEYFDKQNRAKYSNDSLLADYNTNIEWPSSYIDTIVNSYVRTDLDITLIKSNYNFRRTGFYNHLGTNPMFSIYRDSINKISGIVLYGEGRLGQFIVNPFISNFGRNNYCHIYETTTLLQPRELKKFMKKDQFELLFK